MNRCFDARDWKMMQKEIKHSARVTPKEYGIMLSKKKRRGKRK